MKLTTNDMRVLRAMQKALHPSLGGNGDFDGFIPHGSRDWIAVRRLLRNDLIKQLNEYAECQTCPEPHEEAAFCFTHWGMRELVPETPCSFCDTYDCPRLAITEEKRKNPPTGMGGGLWIHGEEYRSAHAECVRRRKGEP
jgi:hypothetical protein